MAGSVMCGTSGEECIGGLTRWQDPDMGPFSPAYIAYVASDMYV